MMFSGTRVVMQDVAKSWEVALVLEETEGMHDMPRFTNRSFQVCPQPESPGAFRQVLDHAIRFMGFSILQGPQDG